MHLPATRLAILLVLHQDLFFEFPLNNFLHNVVYDLLHQILTGRVDKGLNRKLVKSLFRDSQILQRVIDGQRLNDEAW